MLLGRIRIRKRRFVSELLVLYFILSKLCQAKVHFAYLIGNQTANEHKLLWPFWMIITQAWRSVTFPKNLPHFHIRIELNPNYRQDQDTVYAHRLNVGTSYSVLKTDDVHSAVNNQAKLDMIRLPSNVRFSIFYSRVSNFSSQFQNNFWLLPMETPLGRPHHQSSGGWTRGRRSYL